jgi:hypothetical protein
VSGAAASAAQHASMISSRPIVRVTTCLPSLQKKNENADDTVVPFWPPT